MQNAKPVRLVWGTPAVPGGRWRAGLVNLKRVPRSNRDIQARAVSAALQDYRRHHLHLSLRGVLLWCLALGVAAYFTGAAVVLHRLDSHTPHNRVGYLDLAFPWRWSGLDRLRGEALIAAGREALAAGRFQEGFSQLRAGLARHPADAAARLDLARIQARLRLLPHATRLLLAGLDHGYAGRESLETLFALLRDSDQPAKLADACLRARANLLALAESERPVGDLRWLDQQTVRALAAAERAEEALSVVENNYATNDPFRREFTLARLLDTDRLDAADALARSWATEAPGSPEPLRLLVVTARRRGDHATMDETLRALHQLAPDRADALLYAVTQQHLAGRTDATREALDQLLFRHGSDPALPSTLAPVLAEIGYREGLDRLDRECAERGFSPRPVLWARLELAQDARAWPEVEALARDLSTTPGPVLNDARQTWLRTATALARACLDAGSGTQSSLVETVADRPGSLPLYTRILEALLAAGRASTAHDVLVLAEGPYPEARALRDFRARLETALAAATAASASALPAPSSPALASLETFTAEFERLAIQGDDRAALALLSETRRARPDWLAPAAARLESLELPLRARGDDPLRLQLLARATLTRDPHAPDSLLTLARELHASRHQENARLLVKEIVRHQPAHAAAVAQLRLWTAPTSPTS